MTETSKDHNLKEWLLFYILLNERGFVSQLSGVPLEGKIDSKWFYFIYPKSKYPELRYCPENILIISEHERQGVENSELVHEKHASIAEHYEELKSLTKDYEKNFLNPVYEHSKKAK